MLIDRLKPENLKMLEACKEGFPNITSRVLNFLNENDYITDMPYGIFTEMRMLFGEQYSAYDYFI
jgi:hypothetical protein